MKIFAPAKINLALHITGQREDGYHYIESLAAFSDIGDRLTIHEAESFSLTIEGAFSESLKAMADEDNLIADAVSALREEAMAAGKKNVPNCAIRLDKCLPVASGLGGGSSDAAQVMLALNRLWDLQLSDVRLAGIGCKLGADMPFMLQGEAARISGVGECIQPIENFPQWPLLLVNPRQELSTARVYRHIGNKNNAPLAEFSSEFSSLQWLEFLQKCRNDMTRAACFLLPEVGRVLDILAAGEGVVLARMSGSGASCFALFETYEARDLFAQALACDYPEWWQARGRVCPPNF